MLPAAANAPSHRAIAPLRRQIPGTEGKARAGLSQFAGQPVHRAGRSDNVPPVAQRDPDDSLSDIARCADHKDVAVCHTMAPSRFG